jgi:hypothetical protein
MTNNDHKYFYKYVTMKTLRLILENSKIRYSAPLFFNDPFDTQLDLRVGFDREELKNGLKKRFKGYFSPSGVIPTSQDNDTFLAMMREIKSNGLTAEKFEQQFLSDILQGVENSFMSLEEECVKWRKQFNDYMVFCVSETHRNLLMWSHYADEHKGAVIRLKCLPDKDAVLCAARPVQYEHNMPTLANNVEDQIDRALGLQHTDIESIFNKLVFTKSIDWSYEKEWRVVIPLLDESHKNFEDITIYEEEVDGVYFGCRSDESERKEIIKIIKENYPNTKTFKAEKHPDEFKLIFKNC